MLPKNAGLVVIIFIIAVSLLTGCGGGQDGADPGGESKSGSSDPVTMSIASGKAGGTWYPMGGALAEIIQQNVKGSSVSTMQGTGDANIMGVNNGQYTMGISFS